MAEDQAINPENNADAANSVPVEPKSSKKDVKRRQSPEKKKSKNVYVCEVVLLDGTELSIEVEKHSRGEVLFSKVVENLDIVDKEYFGLRFVKDKLPTKCWLQHDKAIKKQLKLGELNFQFAVKFYEPEPGKHLDEYTRYLLYLQLREDIVHGRLDCLARIYILLASFTAQAEFGDYDAGEHGKNYLDGYQFGPEEVEKEPGFVDRIIKLHKEHRGQAPAEAELNFLEVAKRTPRYGVDIHYATNKKGEPIEVGVSYRGVVAYEDGEPVDSYGWKAVDLVAYKRRKFLLKLFKSEKRKNPRFTMNKRRDAKNLYKSAIEHHSFFRLTRGDSARRAADSFIIGSKFRYSDRTLYQIRRDPTIHERQLTGKFSRSPSKRSRKSEKNRVAHGVRPTEDEKPALNEKELGEDFEDIEIDDTQPDHEKYDTSEWTIVEKVLPDGTTKRYRRRIVTSTTTTKTTYVIRKGTEEEGHVMEDKPIESPRKEEFSKVEERRESPEELKEQPKVSEKEVEEDMKEQTDDHHHEIITTTIITEEIISTPENKEKKEETDIKQMSLAEIRAASKKPSAAVKPLMREDIENETTTTTTKKVLVYDPEKEETVKIVTKEEREEELRRREIEEEQRRQDEIRARNEREAALRRKWKEEEQQRKEQEELARKQIEVEEEAKKKRPFSPELQEISLSTGNEEFDKEFGIRGLDTFLIKTSPMPSQFMRELDEELNRTDEGDESKDDIDGDDDEPSQEEKSLSLDTPPVEENHRAKTLDRKFVRRPPPERSSGYIRRSYGNELDFDYSPGSGARTMPRKMRKYVPLITKEELMRAYSSGGLHDESVIRSKEETEEEKSKIEYSLKDESGVEQGQHGFVKNLIGRHETIKIKEVEEIEERRRSRVYSSTDDAKGVVPTRSASFANVEKPETKKTKVPPPVKTKPVVFHPDNSGQAVTPEVRPASAYELSSGPLMNESSPSDKQEDGQRFPIPEVTTSMVVFDSEAPTQQRTMSGYIDKDNVEQIWGKVVLKQRRSFRGSKSFDGIENFDIFKLRERGFLSIDEDHQPKELFLVNFQAPEIVLDKTYRDVSQKNNTVEECRIDLDNNVVPEMVLNDVAVDSASDYLGSKSDWDPNDFVRKDNVVPKNVIVEESFSVEVCADSVHSEIDFDLLENESSDHFIKIGSLGKSENHSFEEPGGIALAGEQSSCDANLDHCVDTVTEIDPNNNADNDSAAEVESKPRLKENEASASNSVVGVTEDGQLMCGVAKEGFDINTMESKYELCTEKPRFEETNLECQSECNVCDSEQNCNNEEQICKITLTELISQIEVSKQELENQQVNENPSEESTAQVGEMRFESEKKTEICGTKFEDPKPPAKEKEARFKIDKIEQVISEKDPSNESCEAERPYEQKRFDSCPNLTFPLSKEKDDDEVFANEPFARRVSSSKERKPRGSYAKLKKQTQKKKAASEGNQTAKKSSFSENRDLGRLKQEYDSTLAAFLKQRSKSLDDVIVATQTISVSPSDTSTGSIITPPPPDVINHSDSMDITDDAFPTPPPDVITQTIVTSSPSTSTTVIETKEFVSSQHPPEVETRTIVISSDGDGKEEFERMISSESVTTSETTVSKTIMTEVKTISSSEQKIVITGEGEVSEQLQQALIDAAENRAEDGK